MHIKILLAALYILINYSAQYATNLYPPQDEAGILADHKDVENRIIGSKIVIALEQCMMLVTWGVKVRPSLRLEFRLIIQKNTLGKNEYMRLIIYYHRHASGASSLA